MRANGTVTIIDQGKALEGRRQKAEGRGQRAEGRGQRVLIKIYL
jgi:hypothetical protein